MFVWYKNHIISIVKVVKGWEQRQSHVNETAIAPFTQYGTVRPDTQVKELCIQTKKIFVRTDRSLAGSGSFSFRCELSNEQKDCFFWNTKSCNILMAWNELLF